MLGDTVTIPKGSRIIGECWATFAAFGQRFSDPGYVKSAFVNANFCQLLRLMPASPFLFFASAKKMKSAT